VGGAGRAEGGPPRSDGTIYQSRALLRYRTIWLNRSATADSNLSVPICNPRLQIVDEITGFAEEIAPENG
jgi:hypothetical protein